MKRIEVVGTDSAFSIETFGKPRRLVLDPITGCSRTPAICGCALPSARQELTAQGNLSEALTELNKALDGNKNSSRPIIVLPIFSSPAQLPVGGQ